MNNNIFKDRNLLVIASNYSSFVKNPVDLVSKNFNHVKVFVRHNPIAEISNYFPINYLKPHRLRYLIDATNKPNNLTIVPVSVTYIPIDIWYKRIGDQEFRKVNSILDKNNFKFDLIHSHFTWTSGYVGVKLKEKYSKPLIITAHGFDIYDQPFVDYEWQKKISYALNQADLVITVCRKNIQYINKLNVQTPVEVIPNGFSSDFFYPMDKEKVREMLQLPKNKKIILTVGRLVPVKGHKFLIEAMSKIIKDEKNLLCLILGSGSQKSYLNKLIKKSNLQDYVKLIGEKSHNEIPVWINSCDIFVLPSLNEGNPTVMFEALGCGKPLIGTNIGGIPEIINSDKYGYICKPGDSEDLVEKILTALDNEWDYENIVHYSKQFTWDIIVKNLLKIYSKILVK
jgi:glycosyltransferase involved in cell wall biosynthesis